jgi:predicted nucleic acid-binding protein
MLSNLFIDTDIILDVLLNRETHYADSAGIFKCFENHTATLYTSSSIIINAQYIGQKQISKEKCKAAIKYLLQYFEILEPTKLTIVEAYNSDFSDIEDAIQYFMAKNSGIIDYIITRNVKDYKAVNNGIPVITPAQFLKILTK